MSVALTDAAAYDAFTAARDRAIVHFTASWCEPCAAMEIVLEKIREKHAGVVTATCDAEAVEDVAEREGVSAVPYFVFYRDGKRVDAVEGADAATVTNKTRMYFPATATQTTATTAKSADAVKPTEASGKQALQARLKSLIESQPVVLFMKGHPDEPKCGFSRKVVDALNGAGIKFGSFNILADEDVRQGLKEYSNWPTYPQLYVDGELLGGCDIILEMAESGELAEACSEASGDGKVKKALNERIKRMLDAQDVILFMKGDRNVPRCGFSGKVVKALDATGVEYATFDILGDEPIRQGLKEYSNWPTYPQLYYKGELIGGCDIILELAEAGELATELGAA